MNRHLLIKIFLVVFLAGCRLFSFGQLKGDYIWELGLSSNPNVNPIPSGIEMSFNNNTITIDTSYRSMSMLYFNSSISNDIGNLLLYTNGCQIRDGNHQYINHTNYLTPGSVDTEWCIQERIGYPVNEGGLFLPFFGDSIILLLHQRLIVEGPPLAIYVDAIFYSSFVKNDSSYLLDQKTIPMIQGYLTDGNVEAVKASKNGAWWVIQGERESNSYYTIRFDSAEVDTIFKQSIGDITFRGSAAGQAVFSPDGKMYARYNPYDDLFLFDFDRSTGTLSNYRKFHVADSGNIGGLAFSPNSRFLYVCARLDMYQFDLWDEDIAGSKVHLGHYDGYVDPFPATFYHMQLGPDCRIYIIPSNGIKVMHVIHHPDLKGLDCGFEQHGFHFPVSNSISIPNFPNYRLDLAPPCDPNIVSGFWEYKVDETLVRIFPNPASGSLTIELGEQWKNEGQVEIKIIDQIGRPFLEEMFPAAQRTNTFSLDGMPGGIYFLAVHSGERWSMQKFVKW